jgi:hypothetical protein
MGTSYRLEGQESELKKHVGHRVEITGTTSSVNGGSTTGTGGSTGTSTGTTSGTTATGSTGGAGSTSRSGADSMGGGAQMRVSSVKMIASDCSGSSK